MNQPLTVALDPTLQAVVDHLRAQAVPALFSLPVEQARERVRLAWKERPGEVDHVRHGRREQPYEHDSRGDICR